MSDSSILEQKALDGYCERDNKLQVPKKEGGFLAS
jgi:hypothetical protein